MKDLEKIILNHEIRRNNSCIAWTIEFILKLHGAIKEDDYTRQESGVPYGFGPKERAELKSFNIDSIEESYEFSDFERISKADAALGYPLVFSLPTSVDIDIQTGLFRDITWHGCVAAHFHHQADYLFRAFKFGGVARTDAASVYSLLRKHVKSGYLIHCLRHRPEGVKF